MDVRRLVRALVVLAIVSPGVAAAEAPSGGAAIAAVAVLEDARRAAMVAADEAALERLLAADMTYVHSTGLVQSRDDVLSMLVRGEIRYVSFTIEGVLYRAYGSTVVGCGVQSIALTNAGKPFTSRSRYTVAYAVVEGAHRMIAYQSTSMPEIVMREKTGE